MIIFDIRRLMDTIVIIIVNIVVVVVEIVVIESNFGAGHLNGKFVNHLVQTFSLALLNTTVRSRMVYYEELAIVTYLVLL